METTRVTEQHVHRQAPIDILLVGEHLIVREGLRKLFEGEPGFSVVGHASDADQAVKAIGAVTPDIVLVSLSGRPLARMILKLQDLTAAGSHTRTILLTTTLEKSQLAQAQQCGVSGILLKDTAPQMLFESVRSVAAGRCWLGCEALDDLAEERRRPMPLHKNRFGLTTRELGVVQGVLRGDTHSSIACQLSIEPDTVKQDLANIFAKIGVLTRLDGAVSAMRDRLTPEVRIVRERAPGNGGRLRHHVPSLADLQSRSRLGRLRVQ
jgi:DNA-binding NarL/FixJ family response regulator